ncbi:hypothetical protein HPB47_002395, partial [Ixodes persulcatus]
SHEPSMGSDPLHAWLCWVSPCRMKLGSWQLSQARARFPSKTLSLSARVWTTAMATMLDSAVSCLMRSPNSRAGKRGFHTCYCLSTVLRVGIFPEALGDRIALIAVRNFATNCFAGCRELKQRRRDPRNDLALETIIRKEELDKRHMVH